LLDEYRITFYQAQIPHILMHIYLAPMQGCTDATFRTLMRKYFGGVELMFTPFLRLEHGELRRRDRRELQALADEPQTIPQILPKNGDEARRLIELVAGSGQWRIDINMCCPFPPVVKSGRGAALLVTPVAAGEILEVTEEYPDLTFSVKLRSGVDDDAAAQELLPMLNKASLAHVTLHPRTARQQYRGVPSAEVFARFYQGSAHPVVYNGDVTTMAQARELMRRYPSLGAVMMGRALVAHPDLLLAGATLPERLERLRLFHQAFYAACESQLSGKAQVLAKMQSFWQMFLPDADRKLRKKILKTRRLEAFEAYTSLLLNDTMLCFPSIKG
jgi:tRNA-dihydrouridine synthase B